MVRQKTLKEVNMVRNSVRSFLLVILLAALPVTGWAQDARAVVSKAAQAMGAENLRTVQYSGSGSRYDEKGQLFSREVLYAADGSECDDIPRLSKPGQLPEKTIATMRISVA